MRTVLLFQILVLFCFYGCKKVDTSPVDYKYDYGYFPLDSGSWREYQVLKITIDKPLAIYDTSTYFIRELIGAYYVDAISDTMRKIHRYYKDSIHHSWTELGVWYAGIKTNEAIQVEENIKYIKQKYPLVLGLSWNGNAYNHIDTLGQFNYEVVQVDMPETINSIAFDSVLKVSQRESLDNYYKYAYYEKFAKGVGLVEKEATNIYSSDIDLNIPIENRVTTGVLYSQKIISYGKMD